MRRLEPKRELKDYESQGSAIRRIMTGEDNYQATMKGHMKDQDKKDKAAGMVKLRKDDDGIHTVIVKQADVQAYIAKGYRRVPIGEEHCCEDCEHMAEGLDIEDAMTVSYTHLTLPTILLV